MGVVQLSTRKIVSWANVFDGDFGIFYNFPRAEYIHSLAQLSIIIK